MMIPFFFLENIVTVLAKYDHRQMYYIGEKSESMEQNVMHAYNMAFGGGGFAISSPLGAELVRIMDGCLNRYFNFYGSDQRVWACVGELGVSLTKEWGFHQFTPIRVVELPIALILWFRFLAWLCVLSCLQQKKECATALQVLLHLIPVVSQ